MSIKKKKTTKNYSHSNKWDFQEKSEERKGEKGGQEVNHDVWPGEAEFIF